MRNTILEKLAVFLITTLPVICSAQTQTTMRLLNDDPVYNKKHSVLIPILEVPLTNGLLWGFDRYVANASYARISSDTIHRNLTGGWIWDTDDFPTNFSLHPYLGSAYFNTARSNGYGFYQSAPFAFAGSAL